MFPLTRKLYGREMQAPLSAAYLQCYLVRLADWVRALLSPLCAAVCWMTGANVALAMLRTASLLPDVVPAPASNACMCSQSSECFLEAPSAPPLLLEHNSTLFSAKVIRPWWWDASKAKPQ